MSIRARIAAGFAAALVCFAAYGVWSIAALIGAGAAAGSAADRPLQALTHAMAADAGFHQTRLLRLGLSHDIYSDAMSAAASEPAIEIVLGDLAQAEQFAASPESVAAIGAVRDAIGVWRNSGALDERRRATELTALFKTLVETAAADSAADRRRVAALADRSLAATAFALAATFSLAAALGWIVWRFLTRPLYAAADYAGRIAERDRTARAEKALLLRPARA